jgi:hypothetical protein
VDAEVKWDNSLEKQIDALYALPLSEFTAARDALAKSLKAAKDGDAAKRVKGLGKPLAIPWAVNQLYWQARPAYNQLAKSGEKLRAAQIAALGGRSVDVQGATAAHRKAVAEAVAIATKFASAADVQPAADALGRMLEAVSLNENPPEPPGRFTRLLQPAGFEALEGLSISALARSADQAPSGDEREAPAASTGKKGPRPLTKAEETRIRREIEAREQRERVEAERRWAADVEKAEAEVARAKAVEEGAREQWERARKRVGAADEALTAIRSRKPA